MAKDLAVLPSCPFLFTRYLGCEKAIAEKVVFIENNPAENQIVLS